MKWYCEKCKKVHLDNEMCPHIKSKLKNHPEWLSEAANYTASAAQYNLVSSNALDSVAQAVNKIAGTNLSYEGTHQIARDIQVFKRLNIERFCRTGVFRSPEMAKNYFENATPAQLQNIRTNLNGMGQEVDWVREQAGKLSSIFQKSELYNQNMAGVDGHTFWRFGGKEITRTTVKAAEARGGINTNVQGIVKALKKGTLKPNETVYGIEGTKDVLMNKLDKEIKFALSNGDHETVNLLRDAQKNLKITEHGNTDTIKQSSKRLTDKISSGNAVTHVTAKQMAEKMVHGAVIGAGVGLTISALTSYVRYKNGELTEREVFAEVSEDTVKSTITGGAMAGITLFLPAGAVGFVGGMAIGVYLNKSCTNILDEIWGKGAYGQILDASGFVYGASSALSDYLNRIEEKMIQTQKHIQHAQNNRQEIDNNFKRFRELNAEFY